MSKQNYSHHHNNIFITGSTGFLGAHILDEYLSTESGIAYCLVRGQNQADSEKRLQDVLRYYFGNKYQGCARIKVVCGDITDGISCDADIDMIIHSAALVKHYGSYNESYKVNVIGTKNVIDLAKKKNAKLIHISTLSVSGNGGTESNGEKAFTESDFYIGQTLDNVYGRTKFEAEKLVLTAINEGLEANICRIGNLSNRYTDAVFQPNYTTNAFLLRLKAILELGMIPENMANYAIEFTPIDYAAKAVMSIASHFNLDRTVFHISNPKALSMPALSQILQAFGIQLKVVSNTVFADALKGMMSTDAEVYKTIYLVFTMDRGSMRLFDSHIHIKNEQTVNYLQLLGFTWCDIDERYLEKWIAYFGSNRFISIDKKRADIDMSKQTYSLTTAQHNILTMSQYYDETSIGNIGGSIEFRMDRLTADVIEKAINHIIENAEGLRLCLCDEDGEIKQYISDYAYTHIPVVTMQSKADADVSKFAKNMVETAIDWHSQPLYRFAILKKANSWVVVSVLHHLIGDAWTFNLLSEYIVNICNDLIAGNSITCEIAPYTAHIANEQAYFESKRYQRSKAFWNEFYAVKPELAKIKPGTAASVSPAAHRLTKELDAEFSANIRAFCDANNMSPAIVFEAATLIYLNRINAEANKPTLGLAVLNRDGAVDRNTMGMFISTVPLTVGVSREETVMELCSTVVDTHMQIFRHQKYPYTHIIHDLRERYSDLDKLYDVMVSYQNATMHSSVKAHTEWYTNGNSEVALALHIDDRDNVGKFVINMDCQLEQFADDEAELVQKRLLHIVEQLVTSPNEKVCNISILPTEEYNTIIHDFNRTEAEYARDKCIHQIFEEQVQKTPNEIAAVCEGKSYTYTEINHMANCIAHALRSHGIGRNDIVPIIAHRSHLVLAAQFGVLKAGGAYLPIDPTFPEERISYMLGDASCKGALVYDATAPASMEFVIDLADNTLYESECENLENINEPSDMCYVIYTSGSTGKPKGTMLLHSNVVNYCAKNEFNVSGKCITDELKKIVSVTTIGFDIYVTESLLALTNGLTVYYANDDESKMQRKLAKLITDNGVEIIQTTPTKMKMFMQDKDNLSYLQTLKSIILGGEVFPESLYEELRELTDAKIYNIYGPTETTVWSSVDEVTSTAVTIGKPIANTQILIIDERGELCPIGISGELCIAGDGVCGGYWNRQELTEEKFTNNRYVPGKLYKTGDLAAFRTDGKLLCYGRMDSQVKIRGLRVELGEIESVMNHYEGIVLSATTVKIADGQEYLIGYYVAEHDIDEKQFKEHLLTHLPKYMCPGWFVRLDEIPFTPNGKIARKKLPDVDFAEKGSKAERKAPITDEEKILYTVVKTFIKGGDFGIDEDFFDLGMDSLTAINLVSELTKVYSCELSVNDVYKHNTVEKMLLHLHECGYNRTTHDLVLIKDGGTRNLFCIHGGNGFAGDFVSPSMQVNDNYTWYGVGYPMEGEFYLPRTISIPQLAAEYVARIRAVQPHGPYHLCGYCIGGLIALEMAYLLEQASEQVEKLFIIASLANDISSLTSRDMKSDSHNITSFLFGDTDHNRSILATASENVWQTVYDHIDEFEIDMSVFRQKVVAVMHPIEMARAVPDYEHSDVRKILYFLNLILSLSYGGSSYIEKRIINAPIYLFSPDQDKMVENIDYNASCWQSHTTMPLNNCIFPGDHFSWYESGKNKEFLEKFEECLKKRHLDK